MGLWRWLKRNTRGVEDLTRDAGLHPDPRNFVHYTIEHAGFQKWVVFVASVGFLTDAYDIFALNIISQILPYVYFHDRDKPPKTHLDTNYQTGLTISTLAGTLIGQALFGYLGDRYGRRKMYGLELIVLIVASISTAMASTGVEGSMDIFKWLVFWRFVMGIGIGADYPLSAVITSEFAPSKHRARMLALVFWMQPLGQVIVLAVAIAVVRTARPNFQGCTTTEPLTAECLRNLDSTWRWVVGLGAVPAALAITFRLTIPQSPRYLIENANQPETAMRKTAAYFGTSDAANDGQFTQTIPLNDRAEQRQTHPYDETVATQDMGGDVQSITSADPRDTITSSRPSSITSSAPSSVPSQVSTVQRANTIVLPERSLSWWPGFKDYFVTQGNWPLLLGTAGNWFLLDIPFYGLGLSYNPIVKAIWPPGTDDLADYISEMLQHQLLVVAVGALVGGAIFLKVIKHISPRIVQFWGFIALTVLLLIMGPTFHLLRRDGLIVLYVLIQLLFNLGPNSTTYLIPAELFPTRYRCTCHGISAAAGRAGGIVAQLLIMNVKPRGSTINEAVSEFKLDGEKNDENTSKIVGSVLAIFCVFTAFGAFVTWFITPETRDRSGRARSLETLAKGFGHIKALNKKDQDEIEGWNSNT